MAFFKSAFLLILALVVLWAGGLLWFTYDILTMKPEHPNQQTDAIAVFTGGKKRIQMGLELWASGQAEHLFITGVHKSVTPSDIRRKWKEKIDLPSCCLTTGEKARSTDQNALEMKGWIESYSYKSIRLVTSDFHMRRAYLELQHALPGVEIIKHPIVQPDTNPSTRLFWHIVFSEYHKGILRKVVLMFSEIFPIDHRVYS